MNTEKLKILHVIPDLRKGGAERLTLDICRELSKRGLEVMLANFREANEYTFLSSEVNRQVIPAKHIPSLTRKAVSQLDRYKKFVEEFQPDIIHSHLFEAEMVTRQALSSRTKYFTHLHDNMPQFRNFSLDMLVNKKLLTNFYEKQILLKQYRKCGNRFIAISNHTAEYFRQALPGDLQNITVLNNAIDVKRFQRDAVKQLRAPFRLVTIGSLVDKKNQVFLVEVVRHLKRMGFNVHLDILGDGPNRSKIERRISEYDLHEQITMHGNVEKVEDFLERAHVYVHAATYEPFGLVLLEAMAAGLPCVALDGKGNRDIAENGKNGFLIDRNEAQFFASELAGLLRDAKLYKQMSDYSRMYAKKFTIGKYADRLIQLYQD